MIRPRVGRTVVRQDFGAAFDSLKAILASYAGRLAVKTDTSDGYLLVAKGPSPFPQHKGQPLHFASVRRGKAYVSFHVMPLYLHPTLPKSISPELKKRMQGKSCFNFDTAPKPEILEELKRLTAAAFEQFGRMEKAQ